MNYSLGALGLCMLSSCPYAGLMSISECGGTCVANMGVDTLFSEGQTFYMGGGHGA